MNNGSGSAEKNSASNEQRPWFVKNGHPNGGNNGDGDAIIAVNNTNNNNNCDGGNLEIGEFRRALPQFLAVSIKNILLFVYGMTLGFPTIVIPSIQGGEGRSEHSDIVLNKEEISWFSSINLICVPLGCLFSGILTQPIGKRRAMQFVNLPILASWLLFYNAKTTEHLYIALCLSGLGGGLMEAPVLTYVAEITEPRYRGILSALGSTCVIAGVFLQFVLGSFIEWRTIAAVSAAFPIFSIVSLCFVPESPIWLIRERRFNEAVKALQWLRGWVPEHEIKAEFNRLYDELITQPALEEAAELASGKPSPSWCQSRLRMFRKRSFLVPFLLVAFTFFTGHFSGKTPLQTYAVQIFHTLKAPINKYHATILLGVAEMIATVLCVVLIHFTGKRPLVLVSTLGVGVCFFGTATYAHYLNVVPGFAVNNVVVNASSILPREHIISQANITNIFQANSPIATAEPNISFVSLENGTANHDDKLQAFDVAHSSALDKQTADELLLNVPKKEPNYLVWLPLILLLSSAFFSHLGIRMIPWILIGEVFPAAIRSTASGFAGGIGYVFGFLANKLFLLMLSELTLPGTFWFYSGVALFGAFVLYLTLPETEGRTLGEIEAHFSKKSNTNLMRKDKALVDTAKRPTAVAASSPKGIAMTTIPATDGAINPAFDNNTTTHL